MRVGSSKELRNEWQRVVGVAVLAVSPDPSSLLSMKKILQKCLGERGWSRERGAKASSTLRSYHSPPPAVRNGRVTGNLMTRFRRW